MKRILFLLPFVGLLCSAVSCVEDSLDVSVNDDTKVLQLSLYVDSLNSKAVVNGSSLPEGSRVGICLFDSDGDGYYQGKDYHNVGYVVNGSKLQDPDTEIRLSKASGTLYAYYPYSAGRNLSSLPLDASAQIDYMYANPKSGLSSSNASASISMCHSMAVLSVNAVKGTYSGKCKASGLSVMGSHLATNAILNGKNGNISDRSGAGSPIALDTEFILNMSGTVNEIMVIPSASSSAATLSLIVDGVTFSASLNDFYPLSGKRYYVTATLNDDCLVLSEVSMNAWENNNEYHVYVSGDTDDIAINQTVNEDGSVIINAVSLVNGESVKDITYSGEGDVNQTTNADVSVITVSDQSGDIYLNFDGITNTSLNYSLNLSAVGSTSILGTAADLSLIKTISIDGVEYPVERTMSLAAGKHDVRIYFQDDVTEVPANLLSGLSVKSIALPDHFVAIGSSAFSNCSGLVSVDLANVKTIGYRAFYECSDLMSINLCGVSTLGESAFSYCSSLESVDLSTVVSYGLNCFTNSGLKSITIPSSVTSFGSGVFSNCDNLSSVYLCEGLSLMGNSMFSSCDALTSIVIPSTITAVSTNAFRYCSNLSSVTIRNGVKALGMYAFDSCDALGTVSLPSSVTNIQNYAFQNSGLKDVSLSEGLTVIGMGAFRECLKLSSITIPSTVTEMGRYAFWNCTNLKHVYCLPITPPSYVGNSYEVLVNNTATLHVPVASYLTYKSWISGHAYLSLVTF